MLCSVEAALGGILTLAGKELPRLHLVYGLMPLAVAFAEAAHQHAVALQPLVGEYLVSVGLPVGGFVLS